MYCCENLTLNFDMAGNGLQAECGTADKMPTTPSPNSASSKDCPPAGPQQDSSALKAEVTKLVAEMQYQPTPDFQLDLSCALPKIQGFANRSEFHVGCGLPRSKSSSIGLFHLSSTLKQRV